MDSVENETQSYDILPRVLRQQSAGGSSRSTLLGGSARRPRTRVGAILLVAAASASVMWGTGCGRSGAHSQDGLVGQQGSAGAGSSRLQVVAAENFWGSIASQLGGAKVNVQSIIVNPNTDPHSYEPTASGRAQDGGRQAGDRQRHRL